MDDLESLQARRKRLIAALPSLEEVLRGSVFVRSLRCGNTGCRCAAGEEHRVTYLSVTFPGGRSEQISLPRDLARTAKQWVKNYNLWRRAIEELSAVNRQVLRQLRRPTTPSAGRQKRKRRRSE
jgi:hypothetical protein